MHKLLTLFALISFSVNAQDSRMFMFLNTRLDKPELPKEEVDKMMQGHMNNINKMAKEGNLLAAGPFQGGGGIFIFKASSNSQVMEWLKGDPGVQANRWTLEMFPYTARVGSVCPVGEPYEMVTYSFVRYFPEVGKEEMKVANELMKEHNDYMKRFAARADVITEASFGFLDGGILILKDEPNKAEVEGDPAVASGLLRVEYKKLYIAKGSFCEK